MKTVTIPLTKTHVESARWLLDCPFFDADAESIAHDWDETPERAAAIVAAAQLARIDGLTLTLPADGDVLVYLHGYAEQLASMAGREGFDELLGKGIDHQTAQCKTNAAVQSAENLADKIALNVRRYRGSF